MSLSLDFGEPRALLRFVQQYADVISDSTPPSSYDYEQLIQRFERGEELSRRDMRRLAWSLGLGEPPLLTRPCFDRALETLAHQGVKAGHLRGAVHAYLRADRETARHSNVTRLRTWLTWNLKAYEGKDPGVLHWKKHQDLFSPDVSPLARRLLLIGPLPEAFRACRVPTTSHVAWSLLMAVAGLVAETVPGKLSELLSLVETDFTMWLPYVVECLLLPVARSASSRHPQLQEFSLKHLGDPRLDRKGHWAKMDPLIKRLVGRWLAERDLHLFFEVVSGDVNRLAFWRSFIDDVHFSRVILGEGAVKRLPLELRGPLYRGEISRLNDSDSDLSAFVLGVGPWYVVEFSKVGHATYGYPEGSGWADKVKSWDKRSYKVNELKAGSQWDYRIRHPNHGDPDWLTNYRQKVLDTLRGLPGGKTGPIHIPTAEGISRRRVADRAAWAQPVARPGPSRASAPPPGWQILKARFAVRCPGCGQLIDEGEQILWRTGDRARHLTCPP